MSCTFTLRRAVLACAVAIPVFVVVGCGSLVPPDISAMMKVGTGQMNTLTGGEIQALATSPIVAAYAPGIQMTDEQADGIAEFLAANHLATITDLQNLLSRAATDPTSVTLPDGFLELFKDFQLPPTTSQPS